MEKPGELGDRQLDALLERLDRITAELERLNRAAEHQEGFTLVARELRELNERLEERVDALFRGVGTGLFDRVRCEVDAEHVVPQPGEQDRVFARPTTDIEHLAVNPAGPLQLDDCGLWLADDPWRTSSLVGIVESGQGWC